MNANIYFEGNGNEIYRYAVEASEIAVAAQTLITANNYGNIVSGL